MKPSAQSLNEARRQHTEAIVARHVRELFKRLPMLTGFWLRSDPTEVSVYTWPGWGTKGICEEVMRSLVALAEELPEAIQLMRGRAFARALH